MNSWPWIHLLRLCNRQKKCVQIYCPKSLERSTNTYMESLWNGDCEHCELSDMKVEDIKDFEGGVIITIPKTKTKILRTREELCKMKPTDIEFRNDVVVVFRKLRRAHPDHLPLHSITFSYWQKYQFDRFMKRKPCTQRYFLIYNNSKCVNTPVGINTIGKIPMKITQFLGLENPWTFTGHSFRRTSATILANHGEGLIGIKQLVGWKSSAVAESYIEDSLHNKAQLSKKIHSHEVHKRRIVKNNVKIQ
ncbi:hypothetical protein PPYR_02622 [Photinus pyralis]|uniref:Tyr recombinase domain-containing protein n=1 Tax=Photinus pyralis TaxID=7054 RepID=A0A5N4B7T7_PHOPY|nr:hypothetical protein PPYR_02622 [Photinus pyralis]